MANAIFRFHGDLEFFLSNGQQNGAVVYEFDEEKDANVAVKHAVESIGVPHTEVDQITANGRVVDFGYGLKPGDVVDVATWIPRPDRGNLRPPLPRPVRFILDTHLGRLAAYLRLMGFDALYRNDYTDEVLAALSHAEGRVLLSRDRGLLKRRIVDFGFCLRQTAPRQQLVSILQHYALAEVIDPWQRCLRCNEPLQPVAKAEILDRLEPKTKRYYEDFRQCAGCGKVYWRGSHYERMQDFISQVLEDAAH